MGTVLRGREGAGVALYINSASQTMDGLYIGGEYAAELAEVNPFGGVHGAQAGRRVRHRSR